MKKVCLTLSDETYRRLEYLSGYYDLSKSAVISQEIAYAFDDVKGGRCDGEHSYMFSVPLSSDTIDRIHSIKEYVGRSLSRVIGVAVSDLYHSLFNKDSSSFIIDNDVDSDELCG